MKNEKLLDMITEAFGSCLSAKEVAELYADIKMENQKQMEQMMKYLEQE